MVCVTIVVMDLGYADQSDNSGSAKRQFQIIGPTYRGSVIKMIL